MEKGFVKKYWEGRYKGGGNSGLGSHDKAAITFKADYVNEVIKDMNIKTMVELGCGDGNQLGLLKGYEKYIGSDISETTINNCSEMYKDDITKEFEYDIDSLKKTHYDLSLSFDVIYHLVEDDVFNEYMINMFNMGDVVCLYTTNKDEPKTTNHIKHRDIEKYVNENHKGFKLIDKTPYTKYNVMFLLYVKK